MILGSPSCSTCIIAYTDSIGTVIGNFSCNDACQTTFEYRGSTVSFPSTSSSCNSTVTDSSSGIFCAFRLTYYYITDNSVHYHGPSYGNYDTGPLSAPNYFNAYLARCINGPTFYCCCQ